MGRFLSVVLVAGVSASQLPLAQAKPQRNTTTLAPKVLSASSALPAIPHGKSTVIGGAIRDVDPVRDQFTLKVFGGHSMKILYDARTEVYLDGAKIPLRDLHAESHASVETMLDGTNVFARSIHILSQAPQGECRGQVIQYNPATRQLTVNAALSSEPIILRVPAGTPIVPVGQAAASSGTSDLVKGTLVSIEFQADTKGTGRGVARHISILAAPGSKFVFTGTISFLDLHSGVLVVTDPRDNKSYKISFDPALFPISHKLHQGDGARVATTFDGTRYVATAITVK